MARRILGLTAVLSGCFGLATARAEGAAFPLSSGAAMDAGSVPVALDAGAVRDGGAAADEPDPPGYRPLIDAALQEYLRGNHAEARALFHRAHALFPNARTHRGIAMTEFELRNYPACIAQLELALQSPARPLDAPLRADAARLLERARLFVGTVAIEARPAASEVRVDGERVPFAPGDALLLAAGEHVLELRAPDHAPERRAVSVVGGGRQAIAVAFAPLVHAPARAVVPLGADASPRPRRWYASPWLWTAVGVVATGAAAATVAVVRGRDEYDRGNTGTLGMAP